MQRKLSRLNTPKIFFFKDKEVPNPNVTVKHLGRIHRDMDHADHAQMATKCIRLGCKMNKSMDLRKSRVIQDCTICKHEDVVFAHGHDKKYKTDFNTDILVRLEPIRNDFYSTDLFSLECLHTGSTANTVKVLVYLRTLFLKLMRPTTFGVFSMQAGQKTSNGVGQT